MYFVRSACFWLNVLGLFISNLWHHLTQPFLFNKTHSQILRWRVAEQRLCKAWQVLTKQVLSPALRLHWRRSSGMSSWGLGLLVQVIFLLYAPWGRSHSHWCFVACESEFTEWQPAAEELKINLLMANGGSSPCWHFVLRCARRAWVHSSLGTGNPRPPYLA